MKRRDLLLFTATALIMLPATRGTVQADETVESVNQSEDSYATFTDDAVEQVEASEKEPAAEDNDPSTAESDIPFDEEEPTTHEKTSSDEDAAYVYQNTEPEEQPQNIVEDDPASVKKAPARAAQAAQVSLTEEYFPDANFRNYLASEFGFVEGDPLSSDQLDEVETVNVSGLSIKDLTGIQYLQKLI